MKVMHPDIPSWVQGFMLLAPLTVLLTGCVGVVPIPAFPNKVQRGERISSSQAAFIHPGETTRREVVAELGADFVELPADPAIAYSWEIAGGGGVWWVVVVTPYGGGGKCGEWVGGWRAFFVAFDRRGCVRATEFKHLSPRRSLHEQLREWVRALPGSAVEDRRRAGHGGATSRNTTQ